MNAQTNVEIGKILFDSIREGDLSSWEAALSDDFTFSYPGLRDGGDKQAAKAFNQIFVVAVPDLTFEVQRTLTDGDTIVYQGVFGGTHTGPLALPTGTIPPTGRRGSVPGVLISVVRNGKIVREETYWNVLELMEQLGAAP
ncbi:MAG: ester cyclase [Candidatus Promineifilaceae bacterium]